MADFRLSYKKAGLSDAAAGIALQARRASTRRTYAGRFERFSGWCADKEIDPHLASLGQVADFLTAMFRQGLQARTVLAYRSAIGALHFVFDNGSTVSNNPVLSNLVKGMFHIRPPTKELIPEWDLSLVLQFIASPEFSAFHKLSLMELASRTAFLLAVACGRRCSEMQALSILPQHRRFSEEGVTLLPRAGFSSKRPNN
jgi:site-specific recombinase XerD